jgi:DNA-binding SARP family transcriptional activator/lipoprotein NlpI
MAVSVYLLGTPRIERDGLTVHVDTRKALALVAFLAVQTGYQSRDTIGALLWPESDQSGARGALRRTLSVLHKALGGTGLHIEREAVALNQAEVWYDLVAFRTALAACGSHGHFPQEVCERCLDPLTQAVSIYKGDFLQGFTLRDSAEFDLWQFQQSEYFRRLHAQALEKLVRLHIDLERYEVALEYAQRWLSQDSLHEPAHRQLIQLYARSGQRSLALRQYRECVRILDQELGVPPLEETTRLYQMVMENKITSVADPIHSVFSPSSEPAERDRASSDTLLPLVGRDAELQQMVECYRQAVRQGKAGSLIVIEGEAGIGKTRLADAFLAKMSATGVRTLLVRCYESEINLAYAPLIRVLRAALMQDDNLERVPDHWFSEIVRLLPELLRVRPNLSPALTTETAGAQNRLFEALSQVFFILLDGNKPGVLAFEDMQWADQASLDLLAYLTRRLNEYHHLVLLTWRTEDVPRAHRLQAMLLEHSRIGGETTVLRLPRLEITSVQDLIDALHLTNGSDLAERLHQESEGLPLFLSEYLRLIRSDIQTVTDPAWSLPLGIQDLLRSRLALLTETGRQLLGAAAVIGWRFDVDLLRESSGRSEEEAVDGLDELLRRGLIQDSDENRPSYEFYHEKLRALVYQEMSMARRRLLHRRTAQALLNRARHTDQLPAFSAQVAYHYQYSGQEHEAAEYFYEAGIHARRVFANREALLYFETALGLNYPDAAALYQHIGDLYTLLGDYDAAIRSYEAAIARCNSDALAHLEHCLARVYHRIGEWELAESYFRSVFERLPESRVSERAAMLADWSLTAYNRSEIARALELAQTALSIADSANEPDARAQAHNMLGILARKQGESDTARFHLERSLEIAGSLHEIGMHIAALNNLALTLTDEGQFAQAQQLLEGALERCARQGDRHHQAALHNNLADLFHMMKQPELAMLHLKQAVALFAQIGVEGGALKPEIWKLAEW